MTNIFLFREKQAELLIRQKNLVHQSQQIRRQVVSDVRHLSKPMIYLDSLSKITGCVGKNIRRYPVVFAGGLALALVLKPSRIKKLIGFGLMSYRVFHRFSAPAALAFDLIAMRVLR